eukprot:3934137-Rhodomonas_salina.2
MSHPDSINDYRDPGRNSYPGRSTRVPSLRCPGTRVPGYPIQVQTTSTTSTTRATVGIPARTPGPA